MKTHLTDIQVRFSDTDLIGHINNTSYATYAETARIYFFRDMNINLSRMILANLSIDFRAQAKFDQPMQIETTVISIGNTSIKLYQKMFSEGTLAAEASSVVVCFDYTNNKAVPVSDEMRTALERYMIDSD